MTDYIHTRLKVSEAHGVKVCFFDKEGAELYDKHIWSVDKGWNTFYLHRMITINGNRTKIYFHRELLGLKDGEIQDHWNRNGLDNRICNLRPSTHQENMCNQRIYKNNKSGIKGVFWDTKNKKWKARITHNENHYHLGYFDNIKEAEKVVRAKRIELHGVFANHG